MRKAVFHDDDSLGPDVNKDWLLTNEWLQACSDHYERAWREINEGPLKELEPYCAKLLTSRWHLPTLLVRVLMLAPTGKLQYLDGGHIAIRRTVGKSLEQPRHRKAQRISLKWRGCLYELALTYAARIGEINRSESATLALRLWQNLVSRRKIFRVPAILAQARSATNDKKIPTSGVNHECIVSATAALPDSRSEWGVVGPSWFEEVVAMDKNVYSHDHSKAASLVVGIDSSSSLDDLTAATREWKRSDSVFIWFLDRSNRMDVLSLIENGWTAVATGGNSRWLAENRPRCPILECAPAVQPLIHNPIGWWNGNQGIQGEMEDDPAIPTDWANKFWEARGRHEASFASADEGLRVGTTKPTKLQDLQMKQKRLRACRDVLQKDRVSQRLDAFLSHLKGARPAADRPLVSVVVATMRPERLPAFFEMFESQVYPSLELILVLNRAIFDQRQLNQLQDNTARQVRILRGSDNASLGELLSLGCDHAEGAYIAKMDDDDYYGPNFLADQIMCLEFSHARVVGKTRSFIHFRSDDQFYLRDSYDEFEYGYNSLKGGTIMFHRDVLRYVGWRPVTRGEDVAFIDDCHRFLIPVVSSDMFNYAHTRTDITGHTWQVDRDYFERKASRCASEVTLRHITC